jgi:hypothetical protein
VFACFWENVHIAAARSPTCNVPVYVATSVSGETQLPDVRKPSLIEPTNKHNIPSYVGMRFS